VQAKKWQKFTGFQNWQTSAARLSAVWRKQAEFTQALAEQLKRAVWQAM
jgi:hypothetical protein